MQKRQEFFCHYIELIPLFLPSEYSYTLVPCLGGVTVHLNVRLCSN